ncbi:hypothetical protein [Salegentibacter sp. F14]
MKAASVSQLKKELSFRSQDELLGFCLRLSKFKKENKELLTYLLFESENEAKFISEVKKEIDEQFAGINTSTWYFIKKSVRKILKDVKKYARYSGKIETEVELLIYFCAKLKSFPKPIDRNKTLQKLYERQMRLIDTKLQKLHEDLQYDYRLLIANFGLD